MNIKLDTLADLALKYYPDRQRIHVKNSILENKTLTLYTKDETLHKATETALSGYSNILVESKVLGPQPSYMGNVQIVGNRTTNEYNIHITIDYETFIK